MKLTKIKLKEDEQLSPAEMKKGINVSSVGIILTSCGNDYSSGKCSTEGDKCINTSHKDAKGYYTVGTCYTKETDNSVICYCKNA